MKFSTRTLYGLKALIALAGRFGEGSLAVSQIAKRENISTPYLEQILNSLKKKGLVKSVRGPQGGYILAKKPQEISLEELLYALAGKNIFDKVLLKNNSATSEISFAYKLFWDKYQEALKTGLSDITLKNLVDESRTLHKDKKSPSSNFHI